MPKLVARGPERRQIRLIPVDHVVDRFLHTDLDLQKHSEKAGESDPASLLVYLAPGGLAACKMSVGALDKGSSTLRKTR